jgi:hypothetical protein
MLAVAVYLKMITAEQAAEITGCNMLAKVIRVNARKKSPMERPFTDFELSCNQFSFNVIITGGKVYVTFDEYGDYVRIFCKLLDRGEHGRHEFYIDISSGEGLSMEMDITRGKFSRDSKEKARRRIVRIIKLLPALHNRILSDTTHRNFEAKKALGF